MNDHNPPAATSKGEDESLLELAQWHDKEAAGFARLLAQPPYSDGASPHGAEHCRERLRFHTSASRLCRASAEADTDSEEAYKIGARDGYESAVQDIDVLTGGDGEYVVSTLPGEGCPDPDAMKARIVARLSPPPTEAVVGSSSGAESARKGPTAFLTDTQHSAGVSPTSDGSAS